MNHTSKSVSYLAYIKQENHLLFFDGEQFSICVNRKDGLLRKRLRERNAVCKEAISKGAMRYSKTKATHKARRIRNINGHRIRWMRYVDES